MTLTNIADGSRLGIKIKTGEEAAADLIECMISVYGKGYNYVNPLMFDHEYLITSIRRGETEVFVGTAADGTPAVAACARRLPHFENSLEIVSLTVSEGFRGFHLGSAIINYILNWHERDGHPLFYAHAVMFYTMACESFEENGFVPTGFLFGVCDAKKHLSQLDYKSRKHSWALYIRNNGCSDVKSLFAPRGFWGFIRERYRALGIEPDIRCAAPPSGYGVMGHDWDDYHKTLYIYIARCGLDLPDRMSVLNECFSDTLKTTVIYININDSGAVYGITTLCDAGFFFAGLMPLCGEFEYAVMSGTDGVYIDMSELKMTAELARVYRSMNG